MTGAVFLDRDGVLNELVLNPANGRYESPHSVQDYRLCPGVIEALGRLKPWAVPLFVVSNQPSYALQKTSLKEIQAIHARLDQDLTGAGIQIRAYYYCYHHPDGLVPGYSGSCACRKPQPFFLVKAAQEFGIDLQRSWMIGDQDRDIACGKRAGCRTIALTYLHSANKRGAVESDWTADNLGEAVDRIERVWRQEES